MTTATAPKRRTRRAREDDVDTTLSAESDNLYPPSEETDIRIPLVPKEQRPQGPVSRVSDADGIEGPEDDEEDDPESPYISFIAATKRYDISRQALHTLCVKGKIPFYLRYNGRRRFLRSEADEYLGLTRVEATDPLPKRSARG